MSESAAASALFVVYAQDIAKVADFYRRTAGLSTSEEGHNFVVLRAGTVEVAVVRPANAIADDLQVASPPRLREETPLKLSLLVDDLRTVTLDASAAGGGTQAPETAWCWRGQLHLDGFDPEGNRVQFRQATIPESTNSLDPYLLAAEA